MKNNVTIFLTPVDAEKYKMFLQYYDFFDLLIEKEVQNTANGSVELHFNEHGQLGSIIKHEMIYRKGKE